MASRRSPSSGTSISRSQSWPTCCGACRARPWGAAGPIIGATLLTALPEVLRPLKEYRDIFAGLILMGVIIYLPRGLVTLAELRKTRRLQEIGVADVA